MQMTTGVVLLCVMALVGVVRGLYISLPLNEEQCFGYEVRREQHEQVIQVVLTYKTRMADASAGIAGSVTLPNERPGPDLSIAADGNEGMFKFDAYMGGLYRICLTYRHNSPDHFLPMQLLLQFHASNDPIRAQWTKPGIGIAAPSDDTYAPMIENVENLITIVTESLSSLSQKQDAFDGTVRSAYRRVVFFTITNIVLVCGIGWWQLTKLRNFFREKKLV